MDKKAEELIDIQANFEKGNGNMKVYNRKNYEEFKKSIEIFLKKNYYFIFQSYLIDHIINEQNNLFNNFLEEILNEFSQIIRSLGDINNNIDQDCVLIRQYLVICFKRKLNSFSENNGIIIKEKLLDNIFPNLFSQKDLINKQSDENLKYHFENSNSFIFRKRSR